MGCLQILQLPHHRVVLGVSYFGRVEHIVKVLVAPQLIAQMFDSLEVILGRSQHISSRFSSIILRPANSDATLSVLYNVPLTHSAARVCARASWPPIARDTRQISRRWRCAMART